jgi:beta-glucosidase
MTGILKRLVGVGYLPKKIYWAIIICVGSAPAHSQGLEPSTNRLNIYHAGWIDFNKNGKQDIFEDPTQPVDKRVEDLLSQMTVEEKTCQLATLYGYGNVLKDPAPTPEWKREVWKDGIANIDEMHNGVGKFNNPSIIPPWSHPPPPAGR